MALINCVECGKEISDRAITCPNCGCPNEKEEKKLCIECGNELNPNDIECPNCGCPIQLNKKNIDIIASSILEKLTKKNLFIIIGVVVVLLFSGVIISKISSPKIDIAGTWKHNSYLISGHYFVEEYTFEKNGRATYIREVVGETEKELKCKYKFRKNNTQIKISCNWDTEDIKEKNNIWVNFEIDGDTIYIDNKAYKNY